MFAWFRKLPAEDALQSVREVALRALADYRTHRRWVGWRVVVRDAYSSSSLFATCGFRLLVFLPPATQHLPRCQHYVPKIVLLLLLGPWFVDHTRAEYPTLANFVATSLDRPVVGESSSAEVFNQPAKYHPASVAAETPVAAFSFDVLIVYANHFRGIRRGVDWVVAAEALERSGGGEDGRSAALALLRWVSWANDNEDVAASRGAPVGSLGIRINARPYVEKALMRHPGDPGLCGAVAALAAATRWPDHAQRVLEAALRVNPFCAALWEHRIALEAGFGYGSMERAGETAAAAASSNALVRLSCGGKVGGESPSALQARTAGRIATIISHPSSRRETKSLSLQAALTGPAQEAALPTATAVVPRSVFMAKNLVSLSLAFNGLLSVPVAIGRLPALRSLDVSGNALIGLPLSLSRLSGTLRVLRAAGNKLGTLSGTPLENLVGLRILDLEHNVLSQFPEAVVRRLTELRTLKLAGNAFCERAPTGLADVLPHLEELTLPALS